MHELGYIVVFTLAGRDLALPLSRVERVAPIVDITPLPCAPAAVLGVINVQGHVLPVFNMRQRFGLPARDLELTDEMVIARTSQRTVALIVDAVQGVRECGDNAIVDAEQILPGLPHVAGVVKNVDGLILIQDLDLFLSLPEEQALTAALSSGGTCV